MFSPGQPNFAEELSSIHRLLQLDRGAEAEAAARYLQRLHPARGDVNEALALVLANVEKFNEAIPFAELAVKAEPRNAGYLINLGRLFLRYELVEEAQPLIEKAFRVDPKMYQAPWAMGDFFLRTGNGERAIRFFKQALSVCRLEDKVKIEFEIADCYSQLGEVDEAENIYVKLAKIPKYRVSALTHIADLRPHTTNSAIFEELCKLQTDVSLSQEAQVRIHASVGKIYESSKEFAWAFEQFRQSKALLKSDFDLSEFQTSIQDRISAYTAEALEHFKEIGDPTRLPVFVVGMPRSGTTLTEQIIAAHPKAAGVGELMRIKRLMRTVKGGKTEVEFVNTLKQARVDDIRRLADSYLGLLCYLAPGAKRVVDKLPHNFLELGFISILFPNARIVHCARNPADTFVSAYQNTMNSTHTYSYTQEIYGHYYKQYLRLMRHWKEVLGDRIFTLQYEQLVTQPEDTAQELLAFLGLPWDSRCLQFYKMGGMVKTFSKLQVRSTVNKGSVAKWESYRSELHTLLEILQLEPEWQESLRH